MTVGPGLNVGLGRGLLDELIGAGKACSNAAEDVSGLEVSWVQSDDLRNSWPAAMSIDNWDDCCNGSEGGRKVHCGEKGEYVLWNFSRVQG